jgi:hypothetical protein
VCLISSGSSGSAAAAGLLGSLLTVDGGAIDKRNKLIPVNSLKRKKISNLRLRIKETLQYTV